MKRVHSSKEVNELMAKEKKVKEKKVLEGLAKFNRVSMPVNILFSVIFIIAALCCVIPLIFVIIISFTDQDVYRGDRIFLYPAEMVVCSV